MSSFLAKSACRGNRPSHLVSCRYYQRPRLVSHLLKERGVSRFVVAPAGFGKTNLALEYAETIFEFNGVFWVNCTSPCFIRDLDAGSLAAAYTDYDPAIKLVVFDDLPFLDQERARNFSGELDRLLKKGHEVLVTCLPSHDVFGSLQQDRVTITADVLLLDDEELSYVRETGDNVYSLRAAKTRSCRIPALVWGGSTRDARAFLSGGFHEEIPSDVLFALVCTAFLGSGSMTDLTQLGSVDVELLGRVAIDHPELGLDDSFDSFEAPPFEIADILFAWRGLVGLVVACSHFSNKEDFACAIAGMLMRAKRSDRACEIVQAICSARRRADWVERNIHNLVNAFCFLPLLRVVESVRATNLQTRQRITLSFVEGFCLIRLGENEAGCKIAKRCAFDAQAPLAPRLLSLMVLGKYGSLTMRDRATAELASVAASVADRSLEFLGFGEVGFWLSRGAS